MNWKIVAGVLAVVVTYDEVTGVINKKRFAHMKKQRNTFMEMNEYLIGIMERNHTPLTRFDQIAIETILEPLAK